MLPGFAALGLVALATTWAAQPIGGREPFSAQLARLACTSDDAAEIEVISAEPFPVRNALTELHIGGVSSSLSRYGDDGDLHTLIFSLTRDQLRAISVEDNGFVRYNPSNGHDIWLIGPTEPASALACGEAEPSETQDRDEHRQGGRGGYELGGGKAT
jgi:hypothetical protein